MNEIPRSDSSLLLHYILKDGVDILGLTKMRPATEPFFAIFSMLNKFVALVPQSSKHLLKIFFEKNLNFGI